MDCIFLCQILKLLFLFSTVISVALSFGPAQLTVKDIHGEPVKDGDWAINGDTLAVSVILSGGFPAPLPYALNVNDVTVQTGMLGSGGCTSGCNEEFTYKFRVSERHLKQGHLSVALKVYGSGTIYTQGFTIQVFDPGVAVVEVELQDDHQGVLQTFDHVTAGDNIYLEARVELPAPSPNILVLVYIDNDLAVTLPPISYHDGPHTLLYKFEVTPNALSWLPVKVTYKFPDVDDVTEYLAGGRTLAVHGPGVFLEGPRDQCAISGKPVRFQCHIKVQETVNWQWEPHHGNHTTWVTSDSRVYDPDRFEAWVEDEGEERKAYLKVREVTDEMNGDSFYCQVTNHRTSHKAVINIVELNPEELSPTVTVKKNGSPINLTDDVIIHKSDVLGLEVHTGQSKPAVNLYVYVNDVMVHNVLNYDVIHVGVNDVIVQDLVGETCSMSSVARMKYTYHHVHESSTVKSIQIFYSHPLTHGAKELIFTYNPPDYGIVDGEPVPPTMDSGDMVDGPVPPHITDARPTTTSGNLEISTTRTPEDYSSRKTTPSVISDAGSKFTILKSPRTTTLLPISGAKTPTKPGVTNTATPVFSTKMPAGTTVILSGENILNSSEIEQRPSNSSTTLVPNITRDVTASRVMFDTKPATLYIKYSLTHIHSTPLPPVLTQYPGNTTPTNGSGKINITKTTLASVTMNPSLTKDSATQTAPKSEPPDVPLRTGGRNNATNFPPTVLLLGDLNDSTTNDSTWNISGLYAVVGQDGIPEHLAFHILWATSATLLMLVVAATVLFVIIATCRRIIKNKQTRSKNKKILSSIEEDQREAEVLYTAPVSMQLNGVSPKSSPLSNGSLGYHISRDPPSEPQPERKKYTRSPIGTPEGSNAAEEESSAESSSDDHSDTDEFLICQAAKSDASASATASVNVSRDTIAEADTSDSGYIEGPPRVTFFLPKVHSTPTPNRGQLVPSWAWWFTPKPYKPLKWTPRPIRKLLAQWTPKPFRKFMGVPSTKDPSTLSTFV